MLGEALGTFLFLLFDKRFVVFAITVFVVVVATVVIAVEISECGAGCEQCLGRRWALSSSSLLAQSPPQILLCPG